MSVADGMLTTDRRGRVCRVFAPPWWAIWRWLEWWSRPREARTVETRREAVPRIAEPGSIAFRARRVRLIVIGIRVGEG